MSFKSSFSGFLRLNVYKLLEIKIIKFYALAERIKILDQFSTTINNELDFDSLEKIILNEFELIQIVNPNFIFSDLEIPMNEYENRPMEGIFGILVSGILVNIAEEIVFKVVDEISSYHSKKRVLNCNNLDELKDSFNSGVTMLNKYLFGNEHSKLGNNDSIDKKNVFPDRALSAENIVGFSLLGYKLLNTFIRKDKEQINKLFNKIDLYKETYHNQKGKEWRKPLFDMAEVIYKEKKYTNKTIALKEAFESMPPEFKNLYSDEYFATEQAIIRAFQRRPII